MENRELSLAELGWNSSFETQVTPEDRNLALAARVTAVHRDRLIVAAPGIERTIQPLRPDPDDLEATATVGDWLLVDRDTFRPLRLLARRSLFKRRAAGVDARVQLIAANVDTLFVMSSCNQDFNVARLERYLALAREAQVQPVVVLTKADLTDDPARYAEAARRIMPGLLVETLDARDEQQAKILTPWCGRGQTVALAGSSGVGKSTLVNALTGGGIATQPIREDDAHGRHTTTARAMHRLPAGGWLIDLPGMRELQLTDVSAGIGEVFADIVSLAARCRFTDCTHGNEPGCQVQAAVASGALEPGRLARWRKLAAEEAYNREAIHERRAREKTFGKLVKGIVRAKSSRWEG